MGIRAIFFDAGETLIHPYPSFAELLADVLRGEGHDVPAGVVQEATSAFAPRFQELAMEGRLWSTSAERSRTFWLGLYREFLGRVGVADPDGAVAAALYRRFTDLSSYRLQPDALPVIERLHAAGLTIGLISNFEEWLERLLSRLDVARYLPVRVISGAEGVEKPDPRIFRIALERAGVEADESVYVGDNPFFDIEAARAVGMLPVLIDRRERYPDAGGIRLTSLEDLPERLGIRV